MPVIVSVRTVVVRSGIARFRTAAFRVPVSRQNSIPAENGAFLPAPQREESELDQELR